METTNKYIHSTEGDSPIFLEMPHSGDIGLTDRSEIPTLIEANLRTGQLVDETLAFGRDQAVPLMSNFKMLERAPHFSTQRNKLARALTDPNRAEEEVSGLALEGMPIDQFNAGVLIGQTVPHSLNFDQSRRELTREALAQVHPLFNRPFTQEEFDAIMDILYRPYQAGIQEHHDRIHAESGKVVHLALHSLPAVNVTTVEGGYVLGGPAERGPLQMGRNVILPDVILIHNNYKAADKVIVDRVRKSFQSEGLIVSDGIRPFIGDNGVTAMYGNPDAERHVLGIEHVTHGIETGRIRGDLEMDYPKAEALQTVYRKVISDLYKFLK